MTANGIKPCQDGKDPTSLSLLIKDMRYRASWLIQCTSGPTRSCAGSWLGVQRESTPNIGRPGYRITKVPDNLLR
jgi:hypothetical protein